MLLATQGGACADRASVWSSRSSPQLTPALWINDASDCRRPCSRRRASFVIWSHRRYWQSHTPRRRDPRRSWHRTQRRWRAAEAIVFVVGWRCGCRRLAKAAHHGPAATRDPQPCVWLLLRVDDVHRTVREARASRPGSDACSCRRNATKSISADRIVVVSNCLARTYSGGARAAPRPRGDDRLECQQRRTRAGSSWWAPSEEMRRGRRVPQDRTDYITPPQERLLFVVVPGPIGAPSRCTTGRRNRYQKAGEQRGTCTRFAALRILRPHDLTAIGRGAAAPEALLLHCSDAARRRQP